MATRVNKGVVVGIVAGLVVLCSAVALLFFYSQLQSGERNVARGDAFMAEGEYAQAASQYGRAVDKHQTNVKYINLYRDAIKQVVPEDELGYDEWYTQYIGILQNAARVQPGRGEIQLEFVDEFVARTRAFVRPSANLADQLIELATRRTEGLSEDDEALPELRGHRGYAQSMKANFVSLDRDAYKQAVEDLEAAYEKLAPTGNLDPLVNLYRLHIAVRGRAEIDGEVDLAAQARDAAAEVVARVQANHADHPTGITILFSDGISRIIDDARAIGSNPDLDPRVDDVFRVAAESLMNIPPEDYPSADVLVSSVNTVVQIAASKYARDFVPYLEGAVEAYPASSDLLLLKALVHRRAGELDEAIDTYELVTQMPNVAVSIEGLSRFNKRRQSIAEQTNIRIDQARASSGEVREERVTQAKERRDRLAEVVRNENRSLLTTVDMKLALIEGDVDKAVTLLDELNAAGLGATPDVLFGYAQALLQRNQPGDAQRKLNELRAIGVNTPEVVILSGEVERSLGNPEAALALYNQGLSLVGSNEFVERRIQEMLIATGRVEAAQVDPVLDLLQRARDLRSQLDYDGAQALLEQAVSVAPADIRPVRLLVSLFLQTDRRDDAVATLNRAIERNPEDARYRAMLVQAQSEDRLAAQLAVIEMAEDTPLGKALAREGVYRAIGRNDEADAQLDIASSIDGNDPIVIEREFARAVRKGEAGIEEATAIVARAVAADADGRDGELFRGRLEIFKGDLPAAIEIFEALVERSAFDAEAWRWLGASQRGNGDIDEAVNSLERAYRSRPSDVGYALLYAQALVSAGRGMDAAAVLSPETGVLRYGTSSDAIVERWMALEGEFGDMQRVLDMRRERFTREPSNASNTGAFVDLLIRNQQFVEALTVIEDYAKTPNATELQIAQLRSSLASGRGDTEGAIAILDEYIARTPESERTSRPYIVKGQLFQAANDPESAVEAYREGRAYQTDSFEVDRLLADAEFNIASQANTFLQSISAADPRRDEAAAIALERYSSARTIYVSMMEQLGYDELIGKRIAEASLRLGDYAGMEAALDEFVNQTGNENDLELLLLRAFAARDQGQDAQMRVFLDRAVENNATNPVAFLRRSQVMFNVDGMMPDVIADLEQAVKLRPSYVEAWALLATAYTASGRPQIGFQRLREAISSNPNNEQLPRILVDQLVRAGQTDIALNEATTRAQQNNSDPYWVSRAARIAQQAGNFEIASRWYERLDEMAPSPEIAADRLDVLLRRPSGVARADVNRLLRRVAEIETTAPEARFRQLLLRARGEAARNAPKAANELLVEAHDIAVPFGPQALDFWVAQTYLRFDSEADPFYSFLENEPGIQPLHPYLMLEKLQPRVRGAIDPGLQSSTLAELEAVLPQIDPADGLTLLRYHRFASNLYYNMQDFERSAAAARAGLEIAPNDVELLNNLAYTLTEHRDQHEEALPFAIRATELAPNISTVADTLGTVYLRLGNYEEAIRILDKAVSLSRTDAERVPALFHRAEAYQGAGRTTDAMRSINQAMAALPDAGEQVRAQYEAKVQSLAESLR